MLAFVFFKQIIFLNLFISRVKKFNINILIVLASWFEEIADRVLLENRESKNMKIARNVIREMSPNSDPMQVLNAIRTDIPNSRLGQCKFLAGVCRMYFNNELTDGQTIRELNQSLKYIASDAHINEYDNNLNGENAETLIQRFSMNRQEDLNGDIEKVNQNQYIKNNDYEIIKIGSFEEAEKYGEYTEWCVTHYEDMYNSYTGNGIGVFYFCLKKGFENLERVKGEGCPLDEYGLSMIAVSINLDGSLNTCTCRWNHDNGGNDNIMDTQEISNLLGVNFYSVFKPRKSELIDTIKRSSDVLQIRSIDGAIHVISKNYSRSDGDYVYHMLGKNNDKVCFMYSHAIGYTPQNENFIYSLTEKRIIIDNLNYVWDIHETSGFYFVNRYGFSNISLDGDNFIFNEDIDSNIDFYNFEKLNVYAIVCDRFGVMFVDSKTLEITMKLNSKFRDASEYSSLNAIEVEYKNSEGGYDLVDKFGNRIITDVDYGYLDIGRNDIVELYRSNDSADMKLYSVGSSIVNTPWLDSDDSNIRDFLQSITATYDHLKNAQYFDNKHLKSNATRFLRNHQHDFDFDPVDYDLVEKYKDLIEIYRNAFKKAKIIIIFLSSLID